MNPGTKMLLGAFADFFGALVAAVTGAMVQGGQVLLPSKGVWILGVLLGAGAFWSHINASLREPPK